MPKFVLFFCVVSLITVASVRASADERPLIAVLDLKGGAAKLTELETLELTELVRQAALEFLGDTHDVITRENLVDLLKSHGKTLEKCQGACETETGRMLGAEIVVTGSIRTVFGRFSVSLKAHSTSPPKVLAIRKGTAEEKNSLPDVISTEASTLFTSLTKPKTSARDHQSGRAAASSNRPEPLAAPAGAQGQTRRPSAKLELRDVIAVGDTHVCALDAKSRPVCWGDVAFGAIPSPPDRPFTNIDSRGGFNCGIDPKGAISCWGKELERWWDVRPPRGTFKKLAVGTSIACALSANGKVSCWGSKRNEGLRGWRAFEEEASQTAFRDISASAHTVCGITTAGSLKCWGLKARQLSRHTGPPADALLKSLSLDDSFACAIDEEGETHCWGSSGTSRKEVPWNSRFVRVSIGDNGACGLTGNGTAQCWGGRLENLVPSGRFAAIDVGGGWACGLRENDSVTCWGPGAKEVNKQTPPQFREQR